MQTYANANKPGATKALCCLFFSVNAEQASNQCLCIFGHEFSQSRQAQSRDGENYIDLCTRRLPLLERS